MKLLSLLPILGLLLSTPSPADDGAALIKERYVTFLAGTEETFTGQFGAEANEKFLGRIKGPIRDALAFGTAVNAGKPFRAFTGDPEYKEETAVYSLLLQRHIPALAYGYCVKGVDNPHYRNPEVRQCYLRLLTYLHGRGIREGMTFHNNENRMHMDGAPLPSEEAANLVAMELRMGALCQSILLMEPHIRDTQVYPQARALVRHLEMLGRTSGHTRYYEPGFNPPEFRHRVQSDAIQNFGDTTLVSALLETDPDRREKLLTEAQHVFTDSLKVIPGWADTIKPDFTGYHHRGIYGNAYTGGFIPQAAFGVHILKGTRFAVDPASVGNLKQLVLTYRLYCQNYAMPFGIRGRMPLNSSPITRLAFPGVITLASPLGIDDADMRPVFARLWDPGHVGIDFLFTGGRGKMFRGFHTLDMLQALVATDITPEPDPSGFWYKPYGGLAIHRRDDWMAAVKGYSASIWDYEAGKDGENVYGQYVSHGSLTIFAKGDPVDDIASGYDLRNGWDWYRMPGTTAVHFPIKPHGPLTYRRFNPDTFLGAASADGRNGVFGMILKQDTFADGTPINLRARKSVFFVDDLIVLLGSAISGGDGTHPVETTLFQSSITDPDSFNLTADALVDPAGNAYHAPDTTHLKLWKGRQKSIDEYGTKPTEGNIAVAWIDHGLKPDKAGYEAAILVNGADRADSIATSYEVLARMKRLHCVRFPKKRLTGYAFFNAQELGDTLIAAVDAPCLVMADASEPNLRIGLSNPDLGLIDPDVRLKDIDFKWISKDEHLFAESQPRPVRLTLNGRWTITSPTKDVSIVSTTKDSTTLLFNCRHGMDLRTTLRAAR